MGFANLDSDAGIAVLNEYIKDKSYIEGFEASQADVVIFEATKAPEAAKYPYAARWYEHIQSAGPERSAFPGIRKPISEYGVILSRAPPKAAEVDLFGSEDEEDDTEAERMKAERLAAYHAKKATKPVIIAKSSVVLDIKPWDDTTDMADLELRVRAISLDGLLWGASELVPIGYGIKKLRISCVIEDDKVGTDLIEEHLNEMDDLVQSMDVHSFNKV